MLSISADYITTTHLTTILSTTTYVGHMPIFSRTFKSFKCTGLQIVEIYDTGDLHKRKLKVWSFFVTYALLYFQLLNLVNVYADY